MKEQLERRPSVVALISLVVGLTSIQHPANLLFIALLLFFCRGLSTWSCCAACLVLGLVLTPPPVAFAKQPVWLAGRARIVSLPISQGDRLMADAQLGDTRFRVEAPLTLGLGYGDLWNVAGVLRAVSEAEEPYYTEQGLAGKMRLTAEATRLEAGPWPWRAAQAWRDHFAAVVSAEEPPDRSVWLEALWFRSGNLSRSEAEELDTSGAFHFVAASGIHVYLLSAIVVAILSSLSCPRSFQVGVLVALLALYGMATGAHLPTIRASFATILYLSAYLFRREPDALSVLAVVSFGFLLAAPRSVYGLGFQLSVTVVAAMALFLPHIDLGERSTKERISGATKAAAFGLAVIFLAGEPILALHTGKLQFGCLPANVLLGLTMPALLTLSLAAYGLHFFSTVLARGLLILAVNPLTDYARWVVGWLGQAGMELNVPAFSPYLLVPYYGFWLLAWRPRVIRA